MIEILDSRDFKEMPWKNGKGTTTELFKMTLSSGNLAFRLSKAKVESNGPFSIFPEIERILCLLKGKGLLVEGAQTKHHFSTAYTALVFQGEEEIVGTLLEGPVIDFNVMTNRSFGSSYFSHRQTMNEEFCYQNKSDYTFIYDIEEEILYKISQGDRVNFPSKSLRNLLIVELNLK